MIIRDALQYSRMVLRKSETREAVESIRDVANKIMINGSERYRPAKNDTSHWRYLLKHGTLYSYFSCSG
jgi:hypothetical protein